MTLWCKDLTAYGADRVFIVGGIAGSKINSLSVVYMM